MDESQESSGKVQRALQFVWEAHNDPLQHQVQLNWITCKTSCGVSRLCARDHWDHSWLLEESWE